jgi:endonuclease/exonuclease/phosphatase family metal-dependent hydrolase
MKLQVATYNIHKGFSHFNLRMALHEIRERLRDTNADLVFLQEVIGGHLMHPHRYRNWPDAPQYEFLADSFWPEFAYGRNAVYDHGHHGNAILSRYPIRRAENQDVSSHAFERRGLLYCEIALPGSDVSLHCMCVHLALHERGRRHQIAALVERVHTLVPEGAPLIIAGDFNDWRGRAGRQLAHALGVQEALRDARGRSARTFPSGLPMLRLDRIYVRGLSIEHGTAHSGLRWSRVSDHALLTARLTVE